MREAQVSDFEYLANLSIGQYLPLSSFFHQRDPRAKLICIILLVISLTLTGSLVGAAVGVFAVLVLLILSQVPLNYALSGLLRPLPFLLLLSLLQVFIAPHSMEAEPAMKIFGLLIYWVGIKAAALLLLKFTGLIILFSVGSASLSTLELIYGLDLLFRPLNRLGLKTNELLMTLQITFRFVPFLAINAERIAKSQASRGADWGRGKMNLINRIRQIVPLLIPLFNGSLRQAETLADAMLARGYENQKIRNGMKDYLFKWTDAIFLIGCGAAAYFILFPKI